MRSVLKWVAFVGAVALSTNAMAGGLKDGPEPTTGRWTGPYVGINAGAAWGTTSFDSSFTCQDSPNCWYAQQSQFSGVNALGSRSANGSGFTGGVQVGTSMQSGIFVYGIEADFGAMQLRGSRTASGAIPNSTNTANVGTSFSTDWLITLRGRLGVTVTPTTLVYATAGLAVTDLKVSNSYSDNDAVVSWSGSSNASTIKGGFTAGGGFEWAMDKHWSLKAEYLYVNIGGATTKASVSDPAFAGLISPNTLSTSGNLDAHLMRAGLNYKF